MVNLSNFGARLLKRAGALLLLPLSLAYYLLWAGAVAAVLLLLGTLCGLVFFGPAIPLMIALLVALRLPFLEPGAWLRAVVALGAGTLTAIALAYDWACRMLGRQTGWSVAYISVLLLLLSYASISANDATAVFYDNRTYSPTWWVLMPIGATGICGGLWAWGKEMMWRNAALLTVGLSALAAAVAVLPWPGWFRLV